MLVNNINWGCSARASHDLWIRGARSWYFMRPDQEKAPEGRLFREVSRMPLRIGFLSIMRDFEKSQRIEAFLAGDQEGLVRFWPRLA